MTKPTLPDMSRKVYEAMGVSVEPFYWDIDVLSWVQAVTPWITIPLHIWYTLYHIEQTSKDRKDYHYAEDNIMSNWKDKRKSIPLDPDESRRPLLEFLLWLI
jgi:hypothetical protein